MTSLGHNIVAAEAAAMPGEQSAHMVSMHPTTRHDNVGQPGAGGINTTPVPQKEGILRPQQSDLQSFNAQLGGIFNVVTRDGRYNFQGARCRVPSSCALAHGRPT